MSQVWAMKHRPTLEGIVGQDHILNALTIPVSVAKNHSPEHQPFPHMIFYSPQAGTGKTSLAHALANEIDYTLHIFNASSKKTRGIEFVEEELLPMSRTGNTKQIFLLDEADQLTPAAQSALKGVIENAHGIFILTCNDLSKVSSWLKSRCMVHTFNPVSDKLMMQRLVEIVGKEGVEITEEQLGLIIRANEGDLRSAINCLQAYHGAKNGDAFVRGLVDEGLDCDLFLTLCFRDKEFVSALKLLEGRNSIRSIFYHGMDSNGSIASKNILIDAAVTAERDYISGVEPSIILANFTRMCCEGNTYMRNGIA
tara:strand:- start:3438 stop:4370 length:933 start_codon:yes stop_codon:yes gene_type:complete